MSKILFLFIYVFNLAFLPHIGQHIKIRFVKSFKKIKKIILIYLSWTLFAVLSNIRLLLIHPTITVLGSGLTLLSSFSISLSLL